MPNKGKGGIVHSRGEGIRLPRREGERHLLRPARSVGPLHTAGERCARLPNRGKGDIVPGGGKVSVAPRREREPPLAHERRKESPLYSVERVGACHLRRREKSARCFRRGGAAAEREERSIGPGRVQRDGRPIALGGKRGGCDRQRGGRRAW